MSVLFSFLCYFDNNLPIACRTRLKNKVSFIGRKPFYESSSTSHANSTDFPDSLFPSVPITHCYQQGFQTTSCIWIYRSSC